MALVAPPRLGVILILGDVVVGGGGNAGSRAVRRRLDAGSAAGPRQPRVRCSRRDRFPSGPVSPVSQSALDSGRSGCHRARRLDGRRGGVAVGSCGGAGWNSEAPASSGASSGDRVPGVVVVVALFSPCAARNGVAEDPAPRLLRWNRFAGVGVVASARRRRGGHASDDDDGGGGACGCGVASPRAVDTRALLRGWFHRRRSAREASRRGRSPGVKSLSAMGACASKAPEITARTALCTWRRGGRRDGARRGRRGDRAAGHAASAGRDHIRRPTEG